jgi:diacylglycerol kinase
MNDLPSPRRSWAQRFSDAFRGLSAGTRGQSTFLVHISVAAVVLLTAAVLRMPLLEWYILLLCIAGVLTAEMFNSALESMAKAITDQRNAHLGNALDIAAAAVLLASFFAALIGALIFAHRLAVVLGWWPL